MPLIHVTTLGLGDHAVFSVHGHMVQGHMPAAALCVPGDE
ncbi:hypothetical protein RISK_002693 [Rhodopirellula islandica]|uniref:Uncharacterized protein n=1 Tax=Rhodopirellula islandica TaxID=595434 RepID=A0A0J1BFK0_RHOIS|nr:hypothetical protein RISK_002693 [Rhodopirellula islandica]